MTKVGAGKDLFLNIRIKPAADLSKLEEVLVLVEKQERQATADTNVRVRAADILAQRLPSVPDKPADAGTAAPAAGQAKPAGASSAAVNSARMPEPAVTGGVPPAKTAIAAPNGASTSQPVKRPVAQPSGQLVPVQKKNSAASFPKPETVQTSPAITEEKPADPGAAQPNPQPPASDNNPN